jgi:phytoene synthase
MDDSLSDAARSVRRHDRERFATALFAPAPKRESLFTLYAFNVELANIRPSVREPTAGLIRLQWWREVLSGNRGDEARRHPVAGRLLELGIPEEEAEAMLEAREHDLEQTPFEDMAALERYASATGGLLTRWACRALGGGDAVAQQTGNDVGMAFALVGLVRSLPFHANAGWMTLPGGVAPDRGKAAEQVAPILDRAEALLACARSARPGKEIVAALLPATIASVHLSVIRKCGGDPFDSRIALPRTSPMRLLINSIRGRY